MHSAQTLKLSDSTIMDYILENLLHMCARKLVENDLKVLFLTANKNNWKQPIDYRLERNCVTFMSCSYIDSHLSIKHNSWVKKINLQEIKKKKKYGFHCAL